MALASLRLRTFLAGLSEEQAAGRQICVACGDLATCPSHHARATPYVLRACRAGYL